MAEVYNKKYKFYKFSKIILCVVAIPFLVLALLSAFVMMNSKNVGGYPSMFGYTVIDLAYDNNMYYGEDANKKIMVQKVSSDEYKVGDIIVYYVNLDDDEPEKEGVFHDQNALSYGANLFNEAMPYADPIIGVDISAVSVGQIGSIGKITETGTNNVYDAFTVYISEAQTSSDQHNSVFAYNVLGKAVEASPFFIDFLSYCASVQSFITLVILPVLVVLALQIMNTIARRAYERSDRVEEKSRIRKQENAQEGASDKTEPVNNYQENLAKTVEGFNPSQGVRQAPPARPTRPQAAPQAAAPTRPAPAPQRVAPVQPSAAPARPAAASRPTPPTAPKRPTPPTRPMPPKK